MSPTCHPTSEVLIWLSGADNTVWTIRAERRGRAMLYCTPGRMEPQDISITTVFLQESMLLTPSLNS